MKDPCCPLRQLKMIDPHEGSLSPFDGIKKVRPQRDLFHPLRKPNTLDPHEGSLPPFEVIKNIGSLRGTLASLQGDKNVES